MPIYGYVVWGLVVIPTIIAAMLLRYSPTTITGNETLGASLVWSLIGVALGYYGLLFSSYAALQVQSLSERYFFEIRTPDLLKKLKKISKAVSDFGNEVPSGLHSQSFMFETAVLLRSAKRVKNRGVKRVAKEAEKSLKHLRNNVKLLASSRATAGSIEGYWDFYQKISELADEMSTQIAEVGAKK